MTLALTPRESGALVTLVEALATAEGVDEVAEVIAVKGPDVVGVNGYMSVFLLSDDGTELRLLASQRSPFSDAEESGRWARIPLERAAAITRAVRTRQPQWFRSSEEYRAEFPENARASEIAQVEGAAILPLTTKDSCLGAVAFAWATPRTFDADERLFCTTLARIFAQALGRNRLLDEQRVARERAESNERRVRLLAEAGALLTTSLVEEEILRRAAEIAVPAFADWLTCDLAQPDGSLRRVLVHHKDRSLADTVARLQEISTSFPDASWVGRALREGESQLVTNATQEDFVERLHSEEKARLCFELGVGSFVSVPILVRGRVEGAISFVRDPSSAPYVPDDVALAEDLTHRAALALESSRLFQTERRHAQDVVRLQRISEGLTVAVSPDDVADVVVRQGLAALGGSSGMLVIHEEKRGGFRVAGLHGVDQALPTPWTDLNIDPGTPLGAAIASGEPVFVETPDEWRERFPDAAKGPLGDIGARAALPLRAGEKVLGALGYTFDAPRRFSDEDRELLVAVARQCSLALERARLYAEQSFAREQTLVLLRVTSALAQAQTRDEVAGAVVEDVVRVLGANAAYLGLLDDDDPSSAHLHFGSRTPRHPHGEQASISIDDETPIGEVVRSGRPLFFERAEDYAARYPSASDAAAAGLESAVFLPITVENRTVGVLGVRFPSRRRFDDEAMRLLETVAIQCSDAFERAELLEREAEARRAAEVANRAKDEFLAMLGHELRNPLMPIVTATSLMRLKGDQHFQRERAMIERQAQHLLRLVDDLLDVSRIARGKIDLRRKRTDVAAVVRQAMETTSPLFEQRRHTLTCELEPELFVDGDAGRLVQVVANLLSNAAKYTEEAGNVHIRGEHEGDDVVVRVRDDGVGMEPALRARVFDLFVQGARGIDRAQGGLGLGLSLVQSIAVLHGGSVEARSDGPGQGSEFIVRLPRASSRADAAPTEVDDERAYDDLPHTPLRILVVDDNVDAADSLAETLEQLGHRTAVAYDGPEGLAKAESLAPEVALLDIGLPVMDGYELARSLKRLHGEEVTLVAVTGYGQPADRARAKEAGFHHHFVKPIHLAGLLALLQRVGTEAQPSA